MILKIKLTLWMRVMILEMLFLHDVFTNFTHFNLVTLTDLKMVMVQFSNKMFLNIQVINVISKQIDRAVKKLH